MVGAGGLRRAADLAAAQAQLRLHRADRPGATLEERWRQALSDAAAKGLTEFWIVYAFNTPTHDGDLMVSDSLDGSFVSSNGRISTQGPSLTRLFNPTAVPLEGGNVAVLLHYGGGRPAAIDRAGYRSAQLGFDFGRTPVFWLGEVVNLLTQDRAGGGGWFAWLPRLGYVPLTEDPVGWMRALLLPWATLAVVYAGAYGRVLRNGLAEALDQDYVRTARAKGLGEARVVLRHALRPSLGTAVALLGLDVGALLGGGTLLVEVVFGLRDERLTIRHDAGGTPEPYVAGTLLAVRRVPELVGLTRGLDTLLVS